MYKNKNEGNRISTLKELLKLDDQEFLEQILEKQITFDEEDMEILTKRLEKADEYQKLREEYSTEEQ